MMHASWPWLETWLACFHKQVLADNYENISPVKWFAISDLQVYGNLFGPLATQKPLRVIRRIL